MRTMRRLNPLEAAAPTAPRSVLVTGAGSGIGRATALSLAEHGFRILLAARRSELLEETRRSIVAAGGAAEARAVDLLDRVAADALASWVKERSPILHGVVHNAGLGGPTPLSALNTAEFDRRLEVNLAAPFRLTRALLPILARDGGGRIVFVSSVLARFGVPDYHAYAASKAGLVGLSRALSRDLARERITVNAVLPGWTRTDMAEASWTRIGAGLGGDARTGEAAALRDVPLGRAVEPAEIAAWVRFLFSPAAASATGQTFTVDGGVCA
jgi:NAD(P)-dependent dehydrogenase (short-subunit alcohol dehydrogenase family)